jgi:hypothetical protein
MKTVHSILSDGIDVYTCFIFYFARIYHTDTDNTGMINFEQLKEALLDYGEQLEEDDIELIESVVDKYDDKIVVNGMKLGFFLIF